MYREIEEDLLQWSKQAGRKPLLLRGARQVGKSYIMEKFGANHFENTIVVNFEFERKFIHCFKTLDPMQITKEISVLANTDIIPGHSLLILDEIQECPEAIMALRYFKEQLPKLHVIAAGSLLEFILSGENFRMPVGRVQSLYMKPCTFKEFLYSLNQHKLTDYLKSVTLTDSIPPAIHETLLKHLREYLFLGGMPEIIDHYQQHQSYQQCRILQASIHEFYRRDFGKYNKKIKIQRLQEIYDQAPRLITQKLQYKKINPDVQSRELKPALHGLRDAGLIHTVYHSSASGLPLKSTINNRKFKLLFVDIGLMAYEAEPNVTTLMNEHLITLNRGAIAEQFVGQELLAHQLTYTAPELYYWAREQPGSTAEIDYVITIDEHIVPIEVKAGVTGRLKSLQIFLDEKKLGIGVQISQSRLLFEKRILSIPLYMISELPRLYRSLL